MKSQILTIFLLVVVSSGVLAKDYGLYGGGSLGQTSARGDAIEADLAADVAATSGGTASYSFDDTSSGWKLFGGFALNRFLAVELAYANLGSIDTEFASDISDLRGTVHKRQTQRFSSSAASLSALGVIPLNGKWAASGKLGWVRWRFIEHDQRSCDYFNPSIDRCADFLSGAGATHTYGNGVLYGLGIRYRITERLAARGEWESYARVGDEDVNYGVDLNMFSAGLEYHFSDFLAGHTEGFHLHTDRLFYGTGISLNGLSTTDAGIGAQVFVGYDLRVPIERLAFDAELGFMNTGDMDFEKPIGNRVATRASGLWAAGVGRLHLGHNIEALARAGVDLGDDAGLLVGTGLGYVFADRIEVRLEYVARQSIASTQLNLVYRPEF